jgi:hypothetical protein
MSADSSAIDHRNGTEAPKVAPYIGQLDRRTARCRVYEECLAGFLSDRGAAASHGEVALCEELAGLQTLIREYRTAHVAGREADIENWLAAFGHFQRALFRLGLGRRQRDVTPSVDQYIAEKRGAA